MPINKTKYAEWIRLDDAGILRVDVDLGDYASCCRSCGPATWNSTAPHENRKARKSFLSLGLPSSRSTPRSCDSMNSTDSCYPPRSTHPLCCDVTAFGP